MVPQYDTSSTVPAPLLDRRSLLVATGAAAVSLLTAFKTAHGMSPAAPPIEGSHLKEVDGEGLIPFRNLHDGKGTIDVKFFFWRPTAYTLPAMLITYTIPPGASEGVHTHRSGDAKEGSFDEYYYILAGKGQMEIDGKVVPVSAGDHLFTPNGVSHGIENTSDAPLKVYLVAMMRD